MDAAGVERSLLDDIAERHQDVLGLHPEPSNDAECDFMAASRGREP
jgi:hypothetical protein